MSYQIIDLDEQDKNDREQYNLIDNEQYFLLNSQNTPSGDENDINNINNSFSNNFRNNPSFDHSNNNDIFMENEYSAAPAPLRRREHEEQENLIQNNIDVEKDILESNHILQNDIKNNIDIEYNFEDEEKNINQSPFSHNDFSCFNQNFLDSDKDIPNISNYSSIEEKNKNNINDINNDINITPYPGMNESISRKQSIIVENSINVNKMDAPINNLSNSSSQNTNAASLAMSRSGNINNLIISTFAHPHKIEENFQNINSTFNPEKKEIVNKEETTSTKNIKTKVTDKAKQKKKNLRKFKPDSIRKKIKARLHKKLRDIINKRLKDCGSKMIFECFPQPFITNVNVIQNKAYLNLTMKTLFKMVFGNKSKDKEKVKINLRVLNYLDSNHKIRVQSGVDNFLNSTYEDILRNYLNGELFKDDVNKLDQEGETKEYIDKYNFIGKHWVEFYKNNGKIIYER